MKKLRTLISALTLAIAIFSLSSNAFAIGAAPLRVQIQGAPGETLEAMVRAQNTEDSDKLVVLTKADFFVREDESLQFIYEYDENNKHSMQNWIEFLENDVPIEANNVTEIPYKINIPEDAQPGGYYGTVFVGSKDALAQDVAGVGIQTVVAQLVLIEVTGGLKTDLETQNIQINEQDQIETTLFNKGNTHDAITGKLIITDSKIEIIEEMTINDGLSNSLPDRPKTFVNPWDRSEYEPGLYYVYLDAETEQLDAIDAELKFEILKDGTLENLKLTKGRSYKFAKLTFSDFPIIPIIVIGFELLVALLFGISKLFRQRPLSGKVLCRTRKKRRGSKLLSLLAMLVVSGFFTGSVLAQDSATITVNMTVKGPCDWDGAVGTSNLTVHDDDICEINGTVGPATSVTVEADTNTNGTAGTLLVGNLSATSFTINGAVTAGGTIEIGNSAGAATQDWNSTLQTLSGDNITVAGNSTTDGVLETVDTSVGGLGRNALIVNGILYAGTSTNPYADVLLIDLSTINSAIDVYVYGAFENGTDSTMAVSNYTYVRETTGAVNGVFTNNGTLNSARFDMGYTTANGGITTNNGTMTFTSNFYIGHLTRDGTLNNTGTLNLGWFVDHTGQYSSGYLFKAGTINNSATGVIIADDFSGVNGGTFGMGDWSNNIEGGTFNNEGTFTIDSYDYIVSFENWGGVFNNNGSGIVNISDRLWILEDDDNTSDGDIEGYFNNAVGATVNTLYLYVGSTSYDGGVLTNYGTIYVTHTSTSFYMGHRSRVFNYGTIDLVNGAASGYLYMYAGAIDAVFNNGNVAGTEKGIVLANVYLGYSGTFNNYPTSEFTLDAYSRVWYTSIFNNYGIHTSPHYVSVGLEGATDYDGGTYTNGAGGDFDHANAYVYKGTLTNAADAAGFDVTGVIDLEGVSGDLGLFDNNMKDEGTGKKITTGTILIGPYGELDNQGTGTGNNHAEIQSAGIVQINSLGKYESNAYSTNDFNGDLIINGGTFDATASTTTTDVAGITDVFEVAAVDGNLTNDGTFTTADLDIGYGLISNGGILTNNSTGTFTVADEFYMATEAYDGDIDNYGTINLNGDFDPGTEAGQAGFIFEQGTLDNFSTGIINVPNGILNIGWWSGAMNLNGGTVNNTGGTINASSTAYVSSLEMWGGAFNNTVGATLDIANHIIVAEDIDGAASAGLTNDATSTVTFIKLYMGESGVNEGNTITNYGSMYAEATSGTGIHMELDATLINYGLLSTVAGGANSGLYILGYGGTTITNGDGAGTNGTINTNWFSTLDATTPNSITNNSGSSMTINGGTTILDNVTLTNSGAYSTGSMTVSGVVTAPNELTVTNKLLVEDGGTVSFTDAVDAYTVGSLEMQAATNGAGNSTMTIGAGATTNITSGHSACQNGANSCSVEVGADDNAGADYSQLTVNGTLAIPASVNDYRVDVGGDGAAGQTGDGRLIIGEGGTLDSNENNITIEIMTIGANGLFEVNGNADLEHRLYVDGEFNVDVNDAASAGNDEVHLQNRLYLSATGIADQGMESEVWVDGSTTEVYGDYQLDGTLHSGHLTVYNGGLMHSSGDDETSTSTNFYIDADNLTIDSGGAISSNGVSSADRTGSTTGGGSHGGEGVDSVSSPTPTFGATKATTPTYGERGENTGTQDGKGGGGVEIYADGNITVNGTISADGAAGTTSSGAGGTVIITQDLDPIVDTAAFFIGSNNITADGGSGSNPGGGGRIVIDSPLIDDPDFGSYDMGEDGGSIHASGGNDGASAYAAAGTVVYLGDRHNTDGTLIIDQGGNAPTGGAITDLTDNVTFDRIEVDNGIAELGTTAYQTCFNLNTSTLYIIRPPTGSTYTCTSLPDKPDSLHIQATWTGTTDTTLTEEPGYQVADGVSNTVYPIGDIGPVFAMYFRNPGDAATHDTVEIQVATSSAFGLPGSCATCVWDATQGGTDGSITLATPITNGTWTEDIEYAGSTLTKGVPYFVRARFRNAGDSASGLWTHGDYNEQYKFTPSSYFQISIEDCNDDPIGLQITQNGAGGGSDLNVASGNRYGWGTCDIHASTSETAWEIYYSMASGETNFDDGLTHTIAEIDNAGGDCSILTAGTSAEEEYGYNLSITSVPGDEDDTLTSVIGSESECSATCLAGNLNQFNESTCFFEIEPLATKDVIFDTDNGTGASMNDGIFELKVHANIYDNYAGDYTVDTTMTIATNP